MQRLLLLVVMAGALVFLAAPARADIYTDYDHDGPCPVHWGDDLEFTITNADLATMGLIATNDAGGTDAGGVVVKCFTPNGTESSEVKQRSRSFPRVAFSV